jgi:hypothetical protein
MNLTEILGIGGDQPLVDMSRCRQTVGRVSAARALASWPDAYSARNPTFRL